MIGNANKLLKNNKYNKDDIICKFGYTNDLVRRTNQHYKTYKKEFNTEIELLLFSIIDPQYICQAEASISHYFNDNKLEGYLIKEVEQIELIIINKNNINQIKEHYKELSDKINKLETELLHQKHINEILILKHDNELKNKNIELLEFKLHLLEKYNK